jgi:putative chitinase
MINRAFFFSYVRLHLFDGTLSKKQVEGLTYILDAWEVKHSKKDHRWLAYALGTTHHETDRKLQPIHEYGNKPYFEKRYDIQGSNPRKARELGNIHPGDGVLFHGRGFVQLTGRANYKKMAQFLGIDMTSSEAAADRALELEYAGKIMFKGMEDGTFTRKKFADYFNKEREDWKNARRIINGIDKANLIAGQAKQYYAAISSKA